MQNKKIKVKTFKNGLNPNQDQYSRGPSHEAIEDFSAVKSAPLTPEQIRRRHAVLIHLGKLEEAKVMEQTIPPIENAAGPVDSIIMSPANPYLSLYREYRFGNLSVDELDSNVAIAVCQDEKVLRAFEHKAPPTKPDDLIRKEAEVREKVSPDQWVEALEKLHKKLSSVPKIDSYLRQGEKIKVENSSNLWWLQSWYSQLKDNHQVYAVRLLAVIETHKAA